jgi:hypothetical protein
MKTTKLMKNTLVSGLVAIVATTSNLKAETISIYDDSFVVNGAPTLAVGKIISGRWGQWNDVSSTFNQAIVTSLNAGYVDLTPSAKELSITLNQTTTTTYAAGQSMALAIFASNSADSQALNWSLTAGGARQSSVVAYAVLTDTSWVTPLFANNAKDVPFTFTANTQAVLGTFTGGAALGAGIQTITMIPEPSSASLLALGMAGFVALRARRKS